LAGGVCDHAALEVNNETAPAKTNPAAIRILFSLNDPASGTGFAVVRPLPAPTHNTLVGAAWPRQRRSQLAADLSSIRLIQGIMPAVSPRRPPANR
jgi:hypothetical protein